MTFKYFLYGQYFWRYANKRKISLDSVDVYILTKAINGITLQELLNGRSSIPRHWHSWPKSGTEAQEPANATILLLKTFVQTSTVTSKYVNLYLTAGCPPPITNVFRFSLQDEAPLSIYTPISTLLCRYVHWIG